MVRVGARVARPSPNPRPTLAQPSPNPSPSPDPSPGQDVGTTTGKLGEKRVVITFNGKFLPFIEQQEG